MMKLVKYTLAVICALVAFQVNAEDAVSRATFTTAIDNREPTDEITDLDNEASKVYYFTEIKGLKGQTITHRWEQNGEVQANVTFNVGGNRWRIWSSKNLKPELAGQWQVMVVDEAGNVLSQNSFNYGDTATGSTASPEITTEISEPQVTETETVSTTEQPATAAPMSEEALSKIAPAAGGNTATTPATPATAE